MTAYEGVMSCYLFGMKTFNSSFSEIEEMELDLLLDLINVNEKITDDVKSNKNKKVFIDDIL